VTDIIAVLNKNAENACNLVLEAVSKMPVARNCKCGSALQHAILTAKDRIPPDTREKLDLLVGKYLV
jgi:5'-methylthioadenosine phosphorylase